MKKTQWCVAAFHRAALAGILALLAGCGEEAASSDPVARAQVEADTKHAMETTSNKKSQGGSKQQSTKNVLQTGPRPQQAPKMQ